MNIFRIAASTAALLIACPVWAQDAEAPTFDVGIQMTAATDYMDVGVTNSKHKPSGGLTLTPTYGILYGTIYGANIDYGTPQPWLETKFAIGAAPTFGKLSFDLNLARRIKFDDPSADRWLPYVTGTYTFNDNLNTSLGVGYYAYDDKDTVDFWEFYAASTITLPNSAYFTGEFYFEPKVDEKNNNYYAPYGTIGVPFMEKFEAIAKAGYEIYEGPTSSYVWSEIGIKYQLTDTLSLFGGYHFNDLSSKECPDQAYTNCRSAVLARLTYDVKLSDLLGRGK